MFVPAYKKKLEKDELSLRVTLLKEIYQNCILCPHMCRVNRNEESSGQCQVTNRLMISSYGPHHGEERPISGNMGSGTIFMTACNLHCIFCQNYDISHTDDGQIISTTQLAAIMLNLQEMGCHNINWVTPTHYVPSLIEGLEIAAQKGLNIPIVYNTSAYDSLDIIKVLHGIIDIYMPDFKLWDVEKSKESLLAEDYPQVARTVIKEMHRQVGDLVLDDAGIARRGLLIRHLVMPGCLDDTRKILEFIAKEISPNTYVNIMDQYRPCGTAFQFPQLKRRITSDEFEEAINHALKIGLQRLDSHLWF